MANPIYPKKDTTDQSVWTKDRSEEWRSIWHSLVSQKEVKLEDLIKIEKEVDKIFIHLQIIREGGLNGEVQKILEKIKPF